MNKKKVINAAKNLLFFATGILLFWLVYRKVDIDKLIVEIKDYNYWWLIIAFSFSIMSNISRAYRWNMLLAPMNFRANTFNAYLSIQAMYLVNLIFPRAGEVARCTILTKYDKIPFSKLFGTVIIERIVDAVGLMIIAAIIILSQLGIFKTFLLNNTGVGENIVSLFSTRNILWALGAMILLFVVVFVFRNFFRSTKLYQKVAEALNNIMEGIKTISKVKNIYLFIGHTLLIYTMWFLMLYVFFLGYEPTKDLNIFVGMTVTVMSGLAMIAPVQGGIGPWHFMVSQTLLIYGLTLEEGLAFAFIAHTATNLFLIFLGLVSLLILPIYNRK